MKKSIIFFSFLFYAALAGAQTKPQCKGIKKDKTQCKITAVNADGYCRFHDPKAPHCAFIKKDGERCKMIIKDKETYCRFHVDGKPTKQ